MIEYCMCLSCYKVVTRAKRESQHFRLAIFNMNVHRASLLWLHFVQVKFDNTTHSLPI